MYAAEFLIERLKEQLALAPALQENTEPGGTVEHLVARLIEGENRYQYIEALKSVEGGGRKYGAHFSKAKAEVEKLGPIFAAINAARNGSYGDQLQYQKAMARFGDKAKEIESICQAAIRELEGALKLLDEGEGRVSKKAAKQMAAA